MSTRILSALLAAASVIVFTSGEQAFAQTAAQPAASGGTGLEEIVVTARRREEKAQAVPITLLSFSPATLQKQDIRDPLKLTDSIPGFNGATGASLGLTYTFLRGAPGVIFYWNQVPINANNQAAGFYFDIDSLQVLYGPQGTLFGLSNDAGALLFEPKHPVNGFEGYGQLTLGNYGRATVEGVVNVPVIDDKLLVRIGGQYQTQDGYQHVIKQNIDLLNQNYWNFRGSVLYRPTDNIQNELMINYFDTQYLPGAFTYAGFNPGPAQAFGSLSLQQILTFAKLGFIGPLAKAQLANVNVNLQQLLNQQQALGKYTLAATSLIPTAVLKQLNIVNTTTWDINDYVTVKNIAAYQEINDYTKADIGGLEFGLLQGLSPLPDQPRGPEVQYNEEIQVLGNLFDNKLNYQAGFFNQWGGSPSGAGGSTPSDSRAPYGVQYTNDFGGVSVSGATLTQVSRTNALYTQETYKLDDYVEGLSFTAGFRYTWDKFYTRGDTYDAFGHLVTPTCLVNGVAKQSPTCPTSQSARFTSPAYSFQLNYQWRPQTMFYINNSLGYKTGGFNGQNFVSFQLFRPEHLNNYEAGIKTDFDWGLIGLDSVKTRFNGSMFYGVYRDIEIQTTGAYLRQTGVLSLGTPYLDVGGGDLWGWDLQLTVLPIPDLQLYVDAEYNKGKYKNFQGPNAAGTGQTSVPGVAFEVLPEYKVNSSITYHLSFIPKEYGDVSWTGAYSWVQHSINTDIANITPFDLLPGHHNIDMNLDWNDVLGYSGVLLRLWVTNLTNNSVVNGCLCAIHAIGEIGYQPAQPQMFGATLRYEFGP
ncbi:MAG TPA: TonB-dependent receptor [Alphaproteobacteria bacterium]|nr:TonB-dependent receptor [Alphaproteobacteria bacterium]